ncbi:hypothetical protein DPMN_012955 [Dreissena polymorpha]|uniref:C2H2-type domain-containing protein n=1 Tax=Dreissena polymorpha TaxID=45954 RepID=A0A9D4N6Z3_DREPO|nr:hypothetical protein DPMN_012955 [Dreissena polymorpha]
MPTRPGNSALECEICNHKATTRAHLREHLKTHSEEKTHVCHVCNAAYKHISSLYRHYGQKHKLRVYSGFTCL